MVCVIGLGFLVASHAFRTSALHGMEVITEPVTVIRAGLGRKYDDVTRTTRVTHGRKKNWTLPIKSEVFCFCP